VNNHRKSISQEAFLISVMSDIEAAILESQLGEYEIPVLKKHKHAGEYLSVYMGATNMGIDLYVPSAALDEAREIIGLNSRAQNIFNEKEHIEDEPISAMQVEYERKRRVKVWIILLFILPGVIWIAVTVFREIFNLLI
jgi:hypothetical protein